MTAGLSIDELDTPCLLLDVQRMRANIERMEARCAQLGVAFRPHLKTAKSLEVAKAIPSARSHGITVSTLREAEYFAAGGFRDILYAAGITPQKLPRVARLLRSGASLTIATDHLMVVAAILAAAEQEQVTFRVALEVDCGEHRGGLQPDRPELMAMAEMLGADPRTEFAGVFTHAGHSYGAHRPEDQRAVAIRERDAVVQVAERLRDSGLDCPMVSVGSTPTALQVDHLAGVTELRAGVFVFQDLFQAGLGCCAVDDIALTVLATVATVHDGHAIIDAGGLAMSKDRSTAELGSAMDAGYGNIMTVGGAAVPGVSLSRAYQEHGILSGPGFSREQFRPGDRLRVLPNHACMTAAAYDTYAAFEGGDPLSTTALWPRINEWTEYDLRR